MVATVNDRPISTKLYEMYLKNGQEALGINPATDEGKKKLDLLKEGVVSELIDRALIAQETERRRVRAEELRRKAAAGADFPQLARETSEDPSSRERGGSLGTFARNSHPKAFDDAAFSTRPGAVSPVIETDFGFHIIKVAAHEAARAQRRLRKLRRRFAASSRRNA